MSVSYEIDPDLALIRTRLSGDVTLEEVLRHFRELEREASLPARLDVLIDLRDMQSVPGTEQVNSAAREVAALRPRIHWGACAVVASRDVLFGIGRMFQGFADSQFSSSNVFREFGEAERWLASLRPRASCGGLE